MKAIVAALIFAFGICAANVADAQAPAQPSVLQSAPVNAVPVQAYSTPSYNTHSAPAYNRSRPGFFGRLLELERRKNAWLRRTFLGR